MKMVDSKDVNAVFMREEAKYARDTHWNQRQI